MSIKTHKWCCISYWRPRRRRRETAHQRKQETAQGTETPDCPESPAPPHSEAPQQQPELAEPLQPPPLGPKAPRNIPLIGPSYNRQLQTLKLRPRAPIPIHLLDVLFVPFIHFITAFGLLLFQWFFFQFLLTRLLFYHEISVSTRMALIRWNVAERRICKRKEWMRHADLTIFFCYKFFLLLNQNFRKKSWLYIDNS